MTQPETAVGGETPVESTDPTAVFEQLAREEFGIEEPAEEGEQPVEEAADEPEIEEEVDDLPPIDAPVSWDAEAKAKFAELPRDTQEYIAKREGEREKFVQSKSQEATRAKQDAVSHATSELAQIEQGYAQQFQQLAAQLAPQAPDPSLIRLNPEAFYAQEAEYRAKIAQQQQLQQQAQQFAESAKARQAQAEQAFHAEQNHIIVENFPEYADPTTGPELRSKLTAVAKEMGYPDELIGQARAQDILAMKQAAQWREDALKYRQLQSKKMEKVRAAKGLPKVATPGVAQGADATKARNATALKETLLTSRNRDVQGAAFMELAKANGWV